MKHKIIAIVGMSGAGKSRAAEYFVGKYFAYIRFGQITMDEIKKRKLPMGEESERRVREELRERYGMGAFATLNIPRIEAALDQKKNVVIDGLYSWSEYKILKEKYGDDFLVVAMYASPRIRYQRLSHRSEMHPGDVNLKFRSFSPHEARSRDHMEIEHIEKGGPIAMADFVVVNEGNFEEMRAQLETVYTKIFSA